MRVILHPGAHCTDEGRLVKCLLTNADRFLPRGVVIPSPSRYRRLLPTVLNKLEAAEAAEDARDVMCDLLIDEEPDSVERVLLSHENLFCVPKLALSGGRFYRKAERRLETMTRLFDGDQVELFLALRNPASFLPALFHASPFEALVELTGGFDPQHFRWSDLIERIRNTLPDMPITIWCNEDSPLIWAEIIRAMAGLQPNEKITGGFTLLAEIMSQKGMKRFRNYLADHPDIGEEEKRLVMVAFLEEFAIEGALEEELDLPGWTDALVEKLTEIYEHDTIQIARMPGVRFLAP
ncbi:hypothetical protein [Primorskyibacter marinus]|uniref:hypothetical protein n=1 Tax=Primorskyibacter marinus TaxID=1977320 RepID=UPI000E307B9E|nr:hypothetical protein [Primorskyibacter marinus]